MLEILSSVDLLTNTQIGTESLARSMCHDFFFPDLCHQS